MLVFEQSRMTLFLVSSKLQLYAQRATDVVQSSLQTWLQQDKTYEDASFSRSSTNDFLKFGWDIIVSACLANFQ